jgi:putative heme-binding domain-containing protein
MKENAIAGLTDDRRDALAEVLNATPVRTSPTEVLAARALVKEWTVDDLVPLIEQGLGEHRDLERGRQLYAAVACASCHRFDQDGGAAGPDLTGVAGRFNLRDFVEAVVEPSKVISDQYRAITIVTNSGRTVTGRIANLSGDGVSVVEDMLAPGDMTRVDRSDIDTMAPSEVSVMPAGLFNTLNEDEIQDLVAYLYSQRQN